MNTFNLDKFKKQAFYEGGKGLSSSQRFWQNCYRIKVEEGNMTPYEAWESCLEEYQKNNGKGDWSLKYA